MSYPAIESAPGVTRQVLSERPELMLVSFRFTTGAVGPLHHHPHLQGTYVVSGRFLFSIDGVEAEVAGGDAFIVPPNAVHGCRCLEAGTMIDSFTPRRDDFL